MDLYMPRLDGFETTRKLRSLEMGGDRVPIIATTANALPCAGRMHASGNGRISD